MTPVAPRGARPNGQRAATTSERRYRIALVLVGLLVTAFVYHGALDAGFVWDDDAQIVQNVYLREPGRIGQALTTDVWGFRDVAGRPTSDYWRPLFVLWLVLNHTLFGLAPAGWHVSGVLLHGAVVVLSAELLRKLGVELGVSAAVVWLFAAHPVHTESVVWISGSTDPLLAVFLLASYLCWLAGRDSVVRRMAAWLLFLAALLTKETAVLFPVLVFVGEWATGPRGAAPSRARRALGAALPFLLLVGVYLLGRFVVLGGLATPDPGRVGPLAVLLTLPGLIGTYLRHLVWPTGLSPVYAFEPVTPDTLRPAVFVLDGLVLVLVAAFGVWQWRRDAISKIGITLAVVFWLPSLNIALLSPDRLLHDRYLYLPSLGALLVAFHALSARIRGGVVLAAGVALVVPCSVLTLRYTPVWTDDVTLWEHASRVSRDSVFAQANLGYYYRAAGRHDEARQALARALEIDPGYVRARVDLGLVAAEQSRHAEAARHFRAALELDPAHEVALERLASVHLAQGRLVEAIGVFEQTRLRLPGLALRSTVNIAALLLQLDRPDLVVRELEAYEGQLRRQSDPALLVGYWYLGEGYRALGQPAEARQAYHAYLDGTDGAAGPMVEDLRGRAAARLQTLRAP